MDYPIGLAFDSSGNLYAANLTGVIGGTIDKFDSSGNRSIFASGLDGPEFIATQVPEPASIALLALGAVIIRRRRTS